MLNAPIPPQFPPGLLALLAGMRGGQQMVQPPAQQPPPPGLMGLVEGLLGHGAPQLERPPAAMSPLAAAAGGQPLGHGAQLPDSGRVHDAVPANPYSPAGGGHAAPPFGGAQAGQIPPALAMLLQRMRGQGSGRPM